MGVTLSPRLALTVGAVAAFVFGVPLVVFPAAVLGSSGVTASDVAISLSRGAGATLIGLGVINWMARNASGEALGARLVGNLVVQALSLVVNAYGVLTGQLPPQSGVASPIHLVLAAVFVLGMRGAR